MNIGPAAALRRLLVAGAGALALMVLGTGAASATEVVYNNFNTVPSTVNGKANTDTYSQDFEGFPFGGMVEFPRARDNVIKSLSFQVDSFACEHGVYSLENCYTTRNKKFKFELTASIYKVGAGDEPEGAAIATASQVFKVPYRPTTNVSCPATGEGKGYGENCDVGGFLATLTFKKFSPAAVLPDKAIIVISTNESLAHEEATPVNVGLQFSYSKYEGGEFIGVGPSDGGVPEVGSDPVPDDAYFTGKLTPEWEEFQPVFKVVTRP